MNVSIIVSTEGYTAFRGVVYVWDGRNKTYLYCSPVPFEYEDATRSHIAEDSAYDDAAAWARQHFPLLSQYIDRR